MGSVYVNCYICVQFKAANREVLADRVYNPGGHYWNYSSGALSLSQITATHLKIKSTGARSSSELQRPDHITGDQERSPQNGCPLTCPVEAVSTQRLVKFGPIIFLMSDHTSFI